MQYRDFSNGIYRTYFTLYALYAYFGLGNEPTIKLLYVQLQATTESNLILVEIEVSEVYVLPMTPFSFSSLVGPPRIMCNK